MTDTHEDFVKSASNTTASPVQRPQRQLANTKLYAQSVTESLYYETLTIRVIVTKCLLSPTAWQRSEKGPKSHRSVSFSTP